MRVLCHFIKLNIQLLKSLTMLTVTGESTDISVSMSFQKTAKSRNYTVVIESNLRLLR